MSWVLVGDALHPHKVGTWSSLSLPTPSEIMLVFHGWQFPPMCFFAHPRCFSVWRHLGLWENGRLWRKVYTGKQQAESFEPSQCIGLCGYCLKCVCSSLVSISFLFFLAPNILLLHLDGNDPSHFWTFRKELLLSFSGLQTKFISRIMIFSQTKISVLSTRAR